LRYLRCICLGLLVLSLAQEHSSLSDEPSPGQPVRLLVPAYFYPAGEGLKAWRQLLDSASQAPIVAIANPDSGPGKRVDDNYTRVFSLARNSPIRILGYVTLSYGKRPLSAVRADIDSWLHFYPDINGIFFDEQPSQDELAAFAIDAFAYARTKVDKALLVTNPGTRCARAYLGPRDSPVACLFEHETGFDKYELPDWAGDMSADRFAVLLYGVKNAEGMNQALREAVRKRTGYLYVTDAGSEPMPWNRLPAYWSDEVRAVRQLNSASRLENKN
jgi:Spherulation-specific family 4